MALDHVLATVRALLADETIGLAEQARLAEAEMGLGEGRVRRDYGWDRWVLAGHLLPATPRWVVSPFQYEPDFLHRATNERHARATLKVRGSAVHADPAVLEDWLLVHTRALLRCFDQVEDYSRTTGGTIALIESPARIDYGAFGPTPTEAGMECTVSLLERSTT